MNQKIFIVSLGCPKNLVDSEVMLGALAEHGLSVCDDPLEADLILVNTCGFIQSAVEEAVDEILGLLEVKKQNPITLLAVTGCLVQRYQGDLQKELSEVDLFGGTDAMDNVRRIKELLLSRHDEDDLPGLLATPSFLMDCSMPRLVSTPAHRAYLKITEGCSNRCSYCMIPSIRGKLRSRQLDDIIAEAKDLERHGVKELTLVGQDLTAYGYDLGPKGPRLPQLLQRLLAETSIPWLRTLYLYPHRITDLQLELMADNPRLLPYLDIPLQHVSDRILELMRRPYGRKEIDGLFGRIKTIMPEVAIRTTFIVGFPGESEQDIVQLEEFIREFKFDHVGIFAYSNEEGSAAAKFAGHLDDEVKEQRRERLMALQAEISRAKNEAMVGRIEKVLVEGLSSETDLLLEGRTRYQAPEVDGCVYINSGTCNPGDIVDLKISEAHTYDLVGEIV